MNSYELQDLNEELKGDLDTIRAEFQIINDKLENKDKTLHVKDLPMIRARLQIIKIAVALMEQTIDGAKE